MKTGIRTHLTASAEVGYSMIVNANIRGKLREITHLKASVQGQKHGTELMRSICREADEDSTVLFLTAATDRLGSWYARFGFRTIQDEPQIMARPPNQ
jgi:N-acetylglutamate synthase-like GNAT family acetyltransferase